MYNTERKHQILHSFPTRRSSDLLNPGASETRFAPPRSSSPAEFRKNSLGPAAKARGPFEGKATSATANAMRNRRSAPFRSEEHTSELQSRRELVCRLLLEKKNKLYDALPRPRLFASLDDAATRPILWLSGAPGAGKTTLVASWLVARRRRQLWYQLDAGDADMATFFHFLRAAAESLAGKQATSLPFFTSEPQQNLARFTRSFFRDFYSALPHPCVAVFDNFHEADTSPEQRASFAHGLDEIPDAINVIVVSRADPPPEFARLAASGRIARIDERELRCTDAEAEAILGSRDQLSLIQRQSNGWVAALV